MSRRMLLLLVVLLVGYPAAFDIFPEVQEWDFRFRLVATGFWIAVASWLGWRTSRQEQRLDAFLRTQLDRIQKQRLLAARDLLRVLLSRGTELPDHYKFRLYQLDRDGVWLSPAFVPEDSDAQSWAVGSGETGRAWASRTYEVARGDEQILGRDELTEEQRRRYEDLKVVAAYPVLNDRGEPIAVLTGHSRQKDDGRLISHEGKLRHQELAVIVGRILVDWVSAEPTT